MQIDASNQSPPAGDRQKTGRAWLLPGLFWVLVLVQLIPVWSVRYLPTADGPAHLYNAWVMKELLTGEATPLIDSYYQVDLRPHPNWMGHLIMMGAMEVVPPRVAEKILVSLIIVLFLAGCWMLCAAVRPSARLHAFLGFPFVYHLLLQNGFYNFSLSVGLFLIVLAVWWRGRADPTPSTIALVGVLLLLCYFSHPMSTVLAMGCIGLLWMASLRRSNARRHWLHLLAFIPVTLLLLWFLRERGGTTVGDERSLVQSLEFLARMQILFTFDVEQIAFGTVLAALMALLAAATAIRSLRLSGHQPEHAFLLPLLAVLIIYFWSPAAIAGGTLVKERMALFVPLLALPWLRPVLSRPMQTALLVLLSLAAAVNALYMTDRYYRFDRIIARYLAHLQPAKPDSVMLPLLFGAHGPHSFVAYLAHAVDYAAIEKRWVDLDNYQPGTGYFPIAYRPDVESPNIHGIEASPESLDFEGFARKADHVFTWHMSAHAPVARRLSRRYRIIHAAEGARLYARRGPADAEQDLELILLPFTGSTRDMIDARGVYWSVEQTVRNRSGSPILLSLSACAYDPDCELMLGPGIERPIGSEDPRPTHALVRVRRGMAKHLEFNTIVKQADRGDKSFSLRVPAVPEGALRQRTLTIPQVRFSPDARVALRLWTFHTSHPTRYALRLRHSGRLIEKILGTDAQGGTVAGDLASLFPEMQGAALLSDIEIELKDVAPNARLWAMVTVTPNHSGEARLYLPR